MALTESSMMPLGTIAPDFYLPDSTSGEMLKLADIVGVKATLVMFICNHCPYVKHIIDGVLQFAQDYAGPSVGIVAINANDASQYPDDSPINMKQLAREKGFTFPYLFDESQQVARAYGATCTPDFFLFDADLKCVYRGQFDGSRPGNDVPVTGRDLRAALDAVLAGKPVSPLQKPGIGCNIKWK